MQSAYLKIQGRATGINRVTRDKTGYTLYELFLLLCCIASAVLLYVRAFYGVDLTDESFYLSEGLTALQGNLPYAFANMHFSVKGYFLFFPQLWLYRWLVPSLEGVVLFSRLSFLTFRLLILFFFWRLLKKHFPRSDALLITAYSVIYVGSSILNYSYNTIPILLLPVAALLLYDVLEKAGGYSAGKLLLTGFLSSLCVFAHASASMAVLTFLVLILLRSNRGCRGRNVLLYAVGGIAEILLVFLPILFQTGWAALWEGLWSFAEPYLPDLSSTALGETLLWGLSRILILAIGVGLLFVARWLWRCLQKWQDGKNRANRLNFLLLLSLIVGLPAMALVMEYRYYGDCIGILVTVYTIFFLCTGVPQKDKIFWYFGVYPLLISFSLAFLTGTNSPLGRFGFSTTAIFGILLILLRSDEKRIRRATVLVTLLLMALTLFCQIRFVYRDEPLAELTTRVESGIYKSLYTTEEQAKDIPELEQYLNSVIEPGEKVAFRDNVPGAYLMNQNGLPWDLKTWDCMQYSYGWNSPRKLYAYYERMDSIPDKIIYIDFGRDDCLSIESDWFRYNDFVNEYYDLTEDICLNDTFYHILVYENNGCFDGDYEAWLNS